MVEREEAHIFRNKFIVTVMGLFKNIQLSKLHPYPFLRTRLHLFSCKHKLT